jgi:hypothetical protein
MLLRPEYLSQNLAAPIHTKDGGTHTNYMDAISKDACPVLVRARLSPFLFAPILFGLAPSASGDWRSFNSILALRPF